MNHTAHAEKRHFNIIDVVIVFAVIAALTFAANVIVNDMFFNEVASVKYVIRITGASEGDSQKMRVGDRILTSSAGTSLGTVESVTERQATVTAFNYETDRFVTAQRLGQFDVFVTVNAKCLLKDSRYLIGDNLISANTCPDIVVPFAYLTADIVSVTPIKESPTSLSPDIAIRP